MMFCPSLPVDNQPTCRTPWCLEDNWQYIVYMHNACMSSSYGWTAVCRFRLGVGFVFLPPPIDRYVGGVTFSGCLSVRTSVRVCILLTWYLTNRWMEFQQTLFDDEAEDTHELISFWRSRDQGQGHSKVKHLSELLWRADASTSTVGCQSII